MEKIQIPTVSFLRILFYPFLTFSPFNKLKPSFIQKFKISLIGFFLSVLSISAIAQNKETTRFIDLKNPPQSTVVWKSPNSLWRVWDSQKYLFVDASGKVVHDMGAYKYVSDFAGGYAVVEKKNGKFGVIDLYGRFVIDTVWSQARNIMAGHFAVAKASPRSVIEDRGQGLKHYPLNEWYLINERNGIIDLSFREITQINHVAICRHDSGKDLTINLNRVNFGYYHPLMKAIEKINGNDVKIEIDEKEAVINFYDTTTSQLNFSLPFNPTNRTSKS